MYQTTLLCRRMSRGALLSNYEGFQQRRLLGRVQEGVGAPFLDTGCHAQFEVRQLRETVWGRKCIKRPRRNNAFNEVKSPPRKLGGMGRSGPKYGAQCTTNLRIMGAGLERCAAILRNPSEQEK